jgi:hypothetical protein
MVNFLINIKSGPGDARKRQTWRCLEKAQKSQRSAAQRNATRRDAKTPAAFTITTAEELYSSKFFDLIQWLR